MVSTENDNVKDLLLKYLITLENISAHHLNAVCGHVAHEILILWHEHPRLYTFCYLFKLYLCVSKKYCEKLSFIHSLIHVEPLPEPGSD